jgi:hypothetical protein
MPMPRGPIDSWMDDMELWHQLRAELAQPHSCCLREAGSSGEAVIYGGQQLLELVSKHCSLKFQPTG